MPPPGWRQAPSRPGSTAPTRTPLPHPLHNRGTRERAEAARGPPPAVSRTRKAYINTPRDVGDRAGRAAVPDGVYEVQVAVPPSLAAAYELQGPGSAPITGSRATLQRLRLLTNTTGRHVLVLAVTTTTPTGSIRMLTR